MRISDSRALNVVARDPETNAPLGGITGHTSLGVLFIDLFFLPEALRTGAGGRWREEPLTRSVGLAVIAAVS